MATLLHELERSILPDMSHEYLVHLQFNNDPSWQVASLGMGCYFEDIKDLSDGDRMLSLNATWQITQR